MLFTCTVSPAATVLLVHLALQLHTLLLDLLPSAMPVLSMHT